MKPSWLCGSTSSPYLPVLVFFNLMDVDLCLIFKLNGLFSGLGLPIYPDNWTLQRSWPSKRRVLALVW